MLEPYMSKEACEGRQKLNDERFRRDKEDIGDLKETMKKVSDVSIKMSLLLEQNQKTQEAHELRITTLERKPSIWFDRIMAAVVGAIIVAVVGAVLAGIF